MERLELPIGVIELVGDFAVMKVCTILSHNKSGWEKTIRACYGMTRDELDKVDNAVRAEASMRRMAYALRPR